MISLHLVWMFLKLIRGKRVISPSSCLDILKIMMKSRGNDLNRQNAHLLLLVVLNF